MIKINDKKINDILKKEDAIEKFGNVLALLYSVFIEAAEIKHSAKSFVHFVEAFSIFLSFNCRTKELREMDRSKLLARAMSNIPISDELPQLVTIEYDDDSAIEYLEKHTEEILMKLISFPNPVWFSEPDANKFSAYLSGFIFSNLRCLCFYEDKIPCTFEIIMGLYNFCKSASLTNDLKGKAAREFFSNENVKSWFNGPI